MVSIMDSLGGITNVTQNITVNPYQSMVLASKYIQKALPNSNNRILGYANGLNKQRSGDEEKINKRSLNSGNNNANGIPITDSQFESSSEKLSSEKI